LAYGRKDFSLTLKRRRRGEIEPTAIGHSNRTLRIRL